MLPLFELIALQTRLDEGLAARHGLRVVKVPANPQQQSWLQACFAREAQTGPDPMPVVVVLDWAGNADQTPCIMCLADLERLLRAAPGNTPGTWPDGVSE